ncbi:hypothetical protein GpartN1_g1347.t1 [Galdieria partita]|uniref:E3 UFM1-protein ligase 1-like N-terminal domain-containing protein n=1 Tax=Galdieria partita TaxID=83374 RepID=A0A9C7PTG8_9RHOD|nr:hypothetical protein GpartN1_g1347.t1 [Galdieria partita]
MNSTVEALRRQLQQVQLGKVKKSLSERNCIELVSKLVERGLVQVLYTQDGREYVTFERLQEEILEELKLHGGRLNLVDLISLLGVDLPYIESAIEKILSKDDTLRLEQGVLFSEGYFASVAQEIEELLQTMNFTTIADLSSRFDLRMDTMKEIVHKYLETVIHGKVEKNTIYNTGYVRQLEATVFGRLKGACLPVSLYQLAKRIQSGVDWIREKTDVWCRQRKLEGFLYGNGENTLFVPNIFDRKRLQIVEENYLHNRYIDYRFLKLFYVQEPQKYCQEHFAHSFLLSSCAVHPDMVSFVESSSLDAIRNGQWLDWNLLLPTHWKREDNRILFSLTSELKHFCIEEPSEQLNVLRTRGEDTNESSLGLMIRWRWIFSIQLIRRFYICFYDWSMKQARNSFNQENLQISDESFKPNAETQVQQNKKKKKGKAKRESLPHSPNNETIVPKLTFSLEQCLDSLRQYPELEQTLEFDALGNTSEEDILRILVEDIFSRALEEIQRDVIREAREQLLLETKMKDERLRSELVKLLQRLHFYSRNLKQFADEVIREEERDVVEQIDSYICRNLGTEVLEVAVTYLGFTLGIRFEGQIVSSKEWRTVLEKLPPYMQESVKQLQAIFRNESKQNKTELFRSIGWLQEYCDRFKNSEVPVVKSLSLQEMERLRQDEFQEIKTTLEDATEAPDVLSKCLKMLLVTYCDVFLIFPGKSIPKLVKIVEARLQSSTRSELQRVFLRLHEIAVDSLKTRTIKNTSEQQTQSDVNAEEVMSVIKEIKCLLRDEQYRKE